MAANKLAQLTKVLESENTNGDNKNANENGGENAKPFHVGIDVHKLSYHLAFRRHDGQTHTFVSPADPGLVVRMIQNAKIRVAQIAYEAGPTGFGLARELAAAGFAVIVVAPSKTPRAIGRDAKIDRLDCIKLAEFSAKGMLSGIAVPTEQEEAERALVRRRHDIVEDIRRTKQRIKSLLLFMGAKSQQSWSEKSIKAIEALPLKQSVRHTIESFLRTLRFLAQEKKIVESQISEISHAPENEAVTACLKSIPGVGDITAATFTTEIFRPERFENAGQVASLVGLAPVVRQSGLKKPAARLIPTGQKRLRALLVEAAWRWRAKDPEAREFYQRMMGKTGLPQKAITAVARKLLLILWTLAVEKRPYRLAAA